MENAPFKHNLLLKSLVAWLVFFWVITAISPADRMDWLLENLLVFVYAGLLVVTYRRYRFSNLSYVLFAVFMTLHLIGAHYTYAETPFGDWMQAAFDLQRNHYDRLVHFAYGLLIAYPFWEVLTRTAGLRTRWSYFLTVNVVLAFSAFFEILEGWIAIIVSPDLGNAYLGTQGDEWDAQRDMFLAFSGAAIAMFVTWLVQRKSSG